MLVFLADSIKGLAITDYEVQYYKTCNDPIKMPDGGKLLHLHDVDVTLLVWTMQLARVMCV